MGLPLCTRIKFNICMHSTGKDTRMDSLFPRVCAMLYFDFLSYSESSTIQQFRLHFHLRNLTKSNLIHICSQQTNIKFHDHYTKSASATVQCIRKILWLRFPSPSSCVPCMNMQPNYQLEMHFNFAKSKLSNVAVAGSFLFSFGCQFYWCSTQTSTIKILG